ncbi:uncharacterized protein TNCV_1367721 [Trichonephila clavipes]|nr:uncharacterized protein TNCV_1367721 [Trichonephila clavipes]
MESLEQFMSFSVFILVVSSMLGLFWLRYKMLFKKCCCCYLGSTTGGLSHCSVIGIVILSASSANRAADIAKEAVLSLPGRIPQYYNELKAILIKDCKQNVCLTLWKLYKIDRSLILCALSVLMNYGILIATLGTVSS